MDLSFIANFLPYGILRKQIFHYTRDLDAVLEYNSTDNFGRWIVKRIPVDVYRVGDGEWIVRSKQKELEVKKAKLQNQIEEIEDRLKAYPKEEAM
jgi:hypothetical protein